MSKASQVHTVMECIPIDGISPDDAAFSGEERRDLAGRPPRTVAGSLALKRALAALVAKVAGCPAPDLPGFVISHDPQGAPVVAAWPDGLAARFSNVCVSIAHSRVTACGAAVYQEAAGE